MIFKTITDQTTGAVKAVTIFGSTLSTMIQNLRSGQGIAYSLFNGNMITEKDTQGILSYLNAIESGTPPLNAYMDHLQDCSVAAQEYAENALNAGKSTEEVAAELRELPKVSRAGQIALKGLAVAGNMLVMLGISKIISGIYELTQVSGNVAQKAKELGASFSDTSADIGNYKEQIASLQETIGDSSASLSDVAEARKNLMAIQDELIEKYGSEQGAINNITDAVNGQTDALDELTQKKWQETLNEFNDGGMANNISNTFHGYSDNVDRMLSEYDDKTLPLSVAYISDAEARKEAEKILSQFGKLEYGTDGIAQIELSGNATEVYDQLLEIQAALSQTNIDFGDSFDSWIRTLANGTKEVSDKYADMYQQYVLNEDILKNDAYADSFKTITKAYKEYQDAVNSNDPDQATAKSEEFAQIVTDAMNHAFENGDDQVADYFRDMYPELQDVVSGWEFNIHFQSNTDNLKLDVSNALNKLAGYNSEDILNFDDTTATDTQIEGYNELVRIARDNHMDIKDLVPLLEDNGFLYSKDYQKLVNTFGRADASKIAKEDLTFAYKIQNADSMTFEEFEAEIQKLKQTADQAASISFTDSLSQVNSLSDGLDQLGKIYADVLDGGDFDWSSILNNEDFKDTFGGFTEEYDHFIQTVSNSPDDIEACQDSFNRLAGAYLSASGILDNVTEETKNATIALLSQAGITNADALVTEALAQNQRNLALETQFTSLTTRDLADASAAEINSLLAEGSVTAEVAEQMSLLAFQKQWANRNTITTSADIKNLAALATTSSKLTQLLSALSSAKAAVESGVPAEAYASTISSLEKQIDEYVNGDFGNATTPVIAGNSFTNSMSSGSAASEAAQETTETFNWLETLLSRIQRKITNFGKTVSAVWQSWSKRGSAAIQQLAAIREELSTQQQAYDAYLAKADSVGLSGYYQDLVKNGSIRIEDITDDGLKEQIKAFQDWYEKALAASDAIADLKDNLADLAKTRFDNVSKQFEQQLSLIEHEADLTNHRLEQEALQTSLADSLANREIKTYSEQ